MLTLTPGATTLAQIETLWRQGLAAARPALTDPRLARSHPASFTGWPIWPPD